jgi:hypothetical protein
MVKLNTAALAVPEFVTLAGLPLATVLVVPTATVAAVPGMPGGPTEPVMSTWPTKIEGSVTGCGNGGLPPDITTSTTVPECCQNNHDPSALAVNGLLKGVPLLSL